MANPSPPPAVGQEILRQGYLGKRSQTKSRFSALTYQLRWFCLNKSSLTYFNSESSTEKQREKGRIPVSSFRWIERASLEKEDAAGDNLSGSSGLSCLGFGTSYSAPSKTGLQIGYLSTESRKVRILYLRALDPTDRDRWIEALRTCVIGGGRKRGSYTTEEDTHFHLSYWSPTTEKWNCCGASGKEIQGCQIIWNQQEDNHFKKRSQTLRRKAGCGTEEFLIKFQSTEGVVISAKKKGDVGLPLHSRESSLVSQKDFIQLVTTEMGGGNTGTPQKIPNAEESRRIVIALYPFKAIEAGDLSLEKGEEYEVFDDSQEHWWQVKDRNGSMGYIPSNYVKDKESLGLQQWDWYVGDMSRQRAETLLRYDDKEGSFVVRNSSTKGLYTLSLYTKVPHPQVKHYHIKQNGRTEFFLSEKHCCASIPELVTYHRHNAGGLASRLKNPPTSERAAPATAGLSHDKWEIDPSELMLHEELGSGQFGVVRRGKWRGSIDVAVKMMKEGTMSEDDFIEEAKVMTKLQHQNLVQLYGVCSKHRPIYIVTEYMRHGALLNYLRRHEATLHTNLGILLDISIQVCKGMAYLERHNYIHRDLAARNCLVGAETVVKVADFGLARYVLDDQYTSSGGTKFPIKWAPPEVLNYTRFSSKSDVWAYGVLMWEVFTCGKMPYGRLKNTEVVDRVQRGQILEKPRNCPKESYEVMKKCWELHPDERPSFRLLKEQLLHLTQSLLEP